MPRPLTKTQLLTQAQKEYDSLEKFLATLAPEQWTAPAMDDWSAKDVLAHLYEWQQMFFRWYEAGLRGETPAVPAVGYKWSQLPALNQKIYETYRDYLWADLLADFRASHAKTIALVESLSGETLTTPGLYPWMNKNSLISYLASTTSSHYDWARSGLRKSLQAGR